MRSCFWLGAAFMVVADGVRFFPEPKGLSLSTGTPFVLFHQGVPIPCVVRSTSAFVVTHMRYEVVIENQVIAQDRAPVRGWWLCGIAWTVFIMVLVLAGIGVLALINTYLYQ